MESNMIQKFVVIFLIFFRSSFASEIAKKLSGTKRSNSEITKNENDDAISEPESFKNTIPKYFFTKLSRLSSLEDIEINDSGVSSSIENRIATPHPAFNTHKKGFLERHVSYSPVVEFNRSLSSRNYGSSGRAKSPFRENLSGAQLLKWREQFFMAVQANDPARLERLSSENDSAQFKVINATDPKQFTYPLHYALQYGLNEAADFILSEMIFDTDAIDSFEHTALSISIERSDFDHFTVLLDRSNVKVLVRGGLGLTHFSASMHTISNMFLQSLARKRLDFKTPCAKLGWTPLKYAAIANNIILTRWIIDNTQCDLSLPANHDIILNVLKAGNEEMAIALLSLNANLNCVDLKNRNALHIIAKKGLIRTLMHIARTRGYSSISGFLESYDSKGFYPIHLAAENNQADMIEYLFGYCDLNVATEDNRSVVQVAIESGSAEVVTIMFKGRLFDYYKSFCNHNPPILVLAFKALKGRSDGMNVIFPILQVFREEYSIDRRYAFDEFGLNIVHYAVMENDSVFIKFLVDEFDFDVNEMENNVHGDLPVNSPLSWAIYANNLPMVKYLLEHGAFTREMIRISCFSPETLSTDPVDPDDEDDVKDLSQLAGIFGSAEIISLIEKYSK